ncbi:Gfo/Idh/MocA family oxidoreductase [Pelagibacteraceae bacterium]|nr:Gfo/Idh/MocA family oxidoreductase [Pelagibacteraceae bacterium]
MGLDRKIKVAFIGTGNMAKEHIKAFSSLENVELAGIFSRTKEKSEALADEFGIGGVYDSIEKLYNATNADIVVVTVSVSAMFKVSVEASDFDWSLFLEKPPAIDLKETSELQSILEAKNRKAFVALNRRFLSSSIAAKENLDKSYKPRFVYIQDQQPLVKIRDMKVHPDVVIENWMYANSIHLIDYFSYFCRGKVSHVKVLDSWKGVDETELVIAHVEYDSGDKGIYECRLKGPGPWAANLSTADIRWDLKPLEKACFVNEGDRTVHEVEQSEADKNFKPGFVVQAEEVVKAAIGVENCSPSLADCITTMKLIGQIYED